MDFQAYHGVSAATHQANVTALSGKGYGMISLSVYGDPSGPEYAAVPDHPSDHNALLP